MGAPHCKAVFGRKFSVPSKSGPKMAVFRDLRVYMLNFCLITPKRHILARNRVVWRITRENRFRGIGCRLLEEPRKKKPSKHFDAQFRAYGEKKPLKGS